MNLLEHALAGWNGSANENLWSSPAWYAHHAGYWFRKSGLGPLKSCRMSRGSKVRINERILKIADDGSVTLIE
jgi:hypothetical protein